MEGVARYFDLRGDEPGETNVLCPFHDDTNPSATLHWEKGLYCRACGEGWTLEQVAEHVGVESDEEEEDEEEEEPPTSAEALLLSRLGEIPEEIGGVELAVGDERLWFIDRNGMEVGRALNGAKPRYKNAGGKADLFQVGEDADSVWLVEGVFDALSLHLVTGDCVYAALGSTPPPKRLFPLRGKTVHILFDTDYAGWKGAQEVSSHLDDLGARGIVWELPTRLGDDPADAYERHRTSFSEWIQEELAELSSDDVAYVVDLFDGSDPLFQLPTGIPTWDNALLGGLAEGHHVVGAATGVGKTTLALYFATTWAIDGFRVLYITYEVPKRQSWARICSYFSNQPWSVLELFPDKAEDTAVEACRDLGERIKVGVGWGVNRILHAGEHYDAIIVDYLQRMPGPHGADPRLNINHNLEKLSSYAAEKGKVIVSISSLSRKGALKESGNIEYVSQSVTELVNAGSFLAAHVTKNTRTGKTPRFHMNVDYQHIAFEERG